ncbi:MraY family glycosyltransferase [Streptosporangium sp. KLBMP 9127]|nr:undecaprenyl/decaprenyl-phosphate alpha-N-acetylglucosaminyl 1-phosphate transferase [Streptosporangium sp. KLBMP 9127]
MNMIVAAAVGMAACGISAATGSPLRVEARRWGLTDRPAAHRPQRRSIPFLGGLAIAAGTLMAVPWAAGDIRLAAILAGALLLAVLGLLGDMRPLRMGTRPAVVGLAACGVALSGVTVPLTGGWADIPLTACWIVVTTCATELLDDMDGALGAVAVTTALLLSLTALAGGLPAPGILLAALAGGCLGFLAHNWPPARMFMGDSGALFIGFAISCSAVLIFSEVAAGSLAGMLAGVLAVTLLGSVNASVVLLARLLDRRPLFRSASDHLSHRMRALGIGRQTAACLQAGSAAVTCMLGLAVAAGAVAPTTAIGACGLAWLVATAVALRIRLTGHVGPAGPRGSTRRPARR